MFRRGAAFWFALSFACAPVLAACSLLLGEGYTDPNADPAADDSGTGADSPSNGGNDGSPNPSPDAAKGSDGSPPVDGGRGRCPDATVSFCDDFERSSLQGEWTNVYLKDGGTLSIESSAVKGQFLYSAVGPPGSHAQFNRPFTITPTKFHLAMTLELPQYAGGGGVYIAGIGMPNGGNPVSLVYFYMDSVGLWLVQQVTDGVSYWRDAIPFATNKPQRLALDVEFNAGVTVTVDGNPVFGAKAKTFLLPKPPSVHLGASSIDDNGHDGAMRVDDFVFSAD